MFDLLQRIIKGKQYGFEKYFMNQDVTPVGKTGIILADIGMPGDFDFRFYTSYMHHVFQYSLPAFIRPLVLADRGIALIDPSNPLARESFTPAQLIDMRGSFTNKQGKPYVECNVKWRPPGMKKNPDDIGYFLYKENGKGGAPDICQKTAAKVVGWYYGHLLPEKKIAWEYQCGKIVEEAREILSDRFPDVEIRHAKYVYKSSMKNAVEALLEKGCQTIIYQCFCNPVYSDFEEYAFSIPMLYQLVDKRAKIICADQLGNQPELLNGYVQLVADKISELPQDSSILIILSKHGHPFKKETMDWRGVQYRSLLEKQIRNLFENRKATWELMWSDDEYADEYWDKKNRKTETFSAYLYAIKNGFDYALEIPTDFIAENTDLMILHAIKKFSAFSGYNKFNAIPYPDWEKPLERTFVEGKTTGVYCGCLVGPYRKYVVKATVNSVSGL